jgi:hypothetical protein
MGELIENKRQAQDMISLVVAVVRIRSRELDRKSPRRGGSTRGPHQLFSIVQDEKIGFKLQMSLSSRQNSIIANRYRYM